ARRKTGLAFRLHDLRHAFGTDEVADGVDYRTLQALMGHADIRTTQLYTHPVPEQLRQAMAIRDRRLGVTVLCSSAGAEALVPANPAKSGPRP
ncbi:MAG: tyrosine-type recombinase/integrase, partial [Deltaproteobacteria bacterium]|nr:tyrosine-type recombinase/integrase [Deltaproteobacteria bacterium]